jgi:hypothetical protein
MPGKPPTMARCRRCGRPMNECRCWLKSACWADAPKPAEEETEEMNLAPGRNGGDRVSPGRVPPCLEGMRAGRRGCRVRAHAIGARAVLMSGGARRLEALFTVVFPGSPVSGLVPAFSPCEGPGRAGSEQVPARPVPQGTEGRRPKAIRAT